MSENNRSDVKLNDTQNGTVSFATEVIATIAGLAATEVDGVASMSSQASGFAEMFARKNPVGASALDAVGMGIGFTAALLLMGMIRELIGSGSLFGLELTGGFGMTLLILPPGGFFVYGVLIALANKLAGKMDQPVREECGDCGNCAGCGLCAGKEEQA